MQFTFSIFFNSAFFTLSFVLKRIYTNILQNLEPSTLLPHDFFSVTSKVIGVICAVKFLEEELHSVLLCLKNTKVHANL